MSSRHECTSYQFRGLTFLEFTVAVLNFEAEKVAKVNAEAQRKALLFRDGRLDRSRAPPFYKDPGVSPGDFNVVLSDDALRRLGQLVAEVRSRKISATADPAGKKGSFIVKRLDHSCDSSRVQLGECKRGATPSMAECFRVKCGYPAVSTFPCLCAVAAAIQVFPSCAECPDHARERELERCHLHSAN